MKARKNHQDLSRRQLRRRLLPEMVEKARTWDERIERNPWTHEYRRVKAEVERTGDDSLFADFQR
jgi:hypothetical protein